MNINQPATVGMRALAGVSRSLAGRGPMSTSRVADFRTTWGAAEDPGTLTAVAHQPSEVTMASCNATFPVTSLFKVIVNRWVGYERGNQYTINSVVGLQTYFLDTPEWTGH